MVDASFIQIMIFDKKTIFLEMQKTNRSRKG